MSNSGKRKHPVQNVETGVIYESLTEAANAHNCHYQQILRAAKEGRLCHGYHWKYTDREFVVRPARKSGGKQKPVLDLTDMKRWGSLTEAASALGLAFYKAQDAIQQYREINGHRLVFELEYMRRGKELERLFVNNKALRFYHKRAGIICAETKTFYESAASCAKELGVSRQAISLALKNHGTVCGKHFYYADENPNAIRFVDPNRRKPSLVVMDLNSSRMWKSIAECAKDLGLTRGTAYRFLRFGMVMKDGTHLVYFRDWMNWTLAQNNP